jgi:hypothetical protein
MIRTRTASVRRFWFPLACLLLAFGSLPHAAQAQSLPSSFVLSASPNPVGDDFSTSLAASLAGNSGIPTGTVDFYVSSTAAICSTDNDDIGTATVNANTGVATLTTGSWYTPGSQPICAIYTPSTGSPYVGETAGVYVLNVDQPALLTVTAPGEVESGTAINFSFAISVPNGQPTPTGTVQLFDENTGTQLGPTVTITNGTVPPINGVTLTAGAYYAYYGGDGNYTGQYAFGTVFQAPGLTVANPDIIYAGSATTTVTLTGLNFALGTTAPGSTAYIANGETPIPLSTTYLSATQVRAVIPASSLTTAGTISVYVATNGYQTNSIQIQVDSPFSDAITVSANPNTFTYGATAATIFGSTVTPGLTTDGGVPAGPINFTLNPGAGGGAINAGTSRLTQNTAATGVYNTSALAALDTGSSKMLTADVNHDGYFDIVSLPGEFSAAGPYLQVMLSTGADTFASEEEVYVGCTPADFAVGDINNDGNPDIVVACQNPDSGAAFPVAEYILGNGDGSFQAPVAFASSSTAGLITSPTQIAVGDFNGDGFLDVALVDGVAGNIQVLFNDANTPFDGVYNVSAYQSFNTTQGEVTQATAADFNQDGKSDVALLEYNFDGDTGGVLVLTSNGTGGFNSTEQDFNAITSQSVSMAVTDVNGDGFPDVAIADPGQPDTTDAGQIIILENTAAGPGNSGALSSAYYIAALGTSSVTGAPFPIVGSPASGVAVAPTWNLLYSSSNATTHALSMTPMQRLGLNQWQNGTTVSMGLNAEYNGDSGYTYPVPMISGDLNGDGYLDATLFGVDANNNTWLQSIDYSNSATASLTNSPAYPAPGSYALTANYPGNLLFAASSSTNPVNITISPATPTGALSGPVSSIYGNQVLITATITGVPNGVDPQGSIAFFDTLNGVTSPLGSLPFLSPMTGYSTITFSTSTLPVGLNTITASYTPVVGAVPQYYNPLTTAQITPLQINVAGLSFSLNLTSSTTKTTSGSVVRFTITATGASFPTLEQVTLTGLPTTSSPTPTLNANGVATWSYGALQPNTYTVQASYNGDAEFAPQNSNSVSVTVGDAPVSVTIQPNVNPDTYPTPISLTSTVTSNGLGIPTGSVDVELGPSGSQTNLGSGNLVTANGSSGLDPLAGFASSSYQEPAIVSGDFNGDGIPDLAWLQTSDGGVQLDISLGNGDGTFQTPVVYTSGVPSGSVALVAGNFNRTAYSGLAIAGTSGSVAVFLPKSDAAGDLALSQTISVPNATGIASADFNKDGNPDLAVISLTTIYVYYGTASGTFPTTASWSYSGDDSNYVSLTATDLNGDGYADVVVSDTGNNLFWVYLYNPSQSTFNTGTVYQAGASVGPIAAGDINGDGFPDIAVVSPSDSTVEVLINNKTGGFPTGSSYGVAGQPDAIAIADFNQDGYADVAVAGTAASEIGVGTTILLGSPSGAMTGEAYLLGGYGTALASADFNGDGNPDLAVANYGITPWIDRAAQFELPSVTLPAGTDALTATYTAAPSTVWAGAQGSFNEIVNQGLPAINWSSPAPITYGTALSGTQLDATSPVAGRFTYTPSAGTVLAAGTQTLTANFAPTDSLDYQANSAHVSIIVNRAGTSVTWSNPAAITYGTALSGTQLNATASVPGTFTYKPAAGTLLTAGTHTLSVTFTPTDTADYMTSGTSVTIVVNKATPGITWRNPAAIIYGTALSGTQLNATAATAGAFGYNPAAGTVLPAGTHTLSATFTPTDTADYTASSTSVTIIVNKATPAITWNNPAAIDHGTPLSATQLDAVATPSGGTFVYTPPAGTVLAQGNQKLSVTYTPADTTDYATATKSVTIVVDPGLALTTIKPSSGTLGSTATTITLTGTGFMASSTVQLSGKAISSAYISPTEMTAVIPASFLQQIGSGLISVTTGQLTTPGVTFTVVAPAVDVQLSGPSTAPPGEQPTLNFALSQAYPLVLQGTFTLTVEPATPGGVVDPAVQFSTGGTTLDFTVPANSTTTPTVQIQTGTLASTITITLTLTADGQDVTPEGLAPVVIDVPVAPPTISSVTLKRNGDSLAVTVQGFSSTRQMNGATFDFTPAAGSSISDPKIAVDIGSTFIDWYNQTASDQYGSAFTYVQNFTLSNNASTIAGVRVTLTNSAGISNQVSAH